MIEFAVQGESRRAGEKLLLGVLVRRLKVVEISC
jgi:hypothetical protein